MITNRELCKIVCLSLINASNEKWHPYKLKKYINNNYSNINNSNIYPAIRLLQEDEMITSNNVDDNRYLTITNIGIDKLKKYKEECLLVLNILGEDNE